MRTSVPVDLGRDMRTKFVHKCLVVKDPKYPYWLVFDKSCGFLGSYKSWTRAVTVGIWHFKLKLEEGVQKVLYEHSTSRGEAPF